MTVHYHRQALTRHGEEVLGLEHQALGRGVVGVAPPWQAMASTAAMAESSSEGWKYMSSLPKRFFWPLAATRAKVSAMGVEGNGVAAETVDQAGQHRNGRLVAIHQDVLPFTHILKQGWGMVARSKAKSSLASKRSHSVGQSMGSTWPFLTCRSRW